MPAPLSRRTVLTALTAIGALPFGRSALAQALSFSGGEAGPFPFTFDELIAAAKGAAAQPYRAPETPSPDVLDRLTYDEHWRIRYKPEAAPAVGPYPVQFFHLGKYAREPVRMYLLSDGTATPFRYSPDLFEMPADSPAHELGDNTGFAGFRLQRPGGLPDWIAFLGASYFRCDGPEKQYGISTRGLAVNIGTALEEEFPRFSAFFIGGPERPGEEACIYAELDGKRCTGAYRIGVHLGEDGGQRCLIECHIFAREPIERLGIAPLTSMFWYDEMNRAEDATDWRPEIHDSDGLAILTGAGERIWRPLSNPKRILVSSFVDPNVQGFGMIQRDREFENYQDDGVFYNKRPSVWVTPNSPFGPGSVQLLLIPTTDETFDNAVAYFAPDGTLAPGDSRSYSYTLDWTRIDPAPFEMARVVASYRGVGGPPGVKVPPKDTRVYVIDFDGGRLSGVTSAELDVTTSGGTISRVSARPVVGTSRWRGMFDLTVDPATPVDLRAYLRDASGPLSETWTTLAEG